jgi:methionine synthase II (cobalamin-independent)
MRNSSHAILTTHAGRLPIPPGCEDLPLRIFSGQGVDDAQIEQAIADTVRKQADIGIDCVGDGEFWKARNIAYYGAHLTGVETRPLKAGEVATTRKPHPRARRVHEFLRGHGPHGHLVLYARGKADAAGS